MSVSDPKRIFVTLANSTFLLLSSNLLWDATESINCKNVRKTSLAELDGARQANYIGKVDQLYK